MFSSSILVFYQLSIVNNQKKHWSHLKNEDKWLKWASTQMKELFEHHGVTLCDTRNIIAALPFYFSPLCHVQLFSLHCFVYFYITINRLYGQTIGLLEEQTTLLENV